MPGPLTVRLLGPFEVAVDGRSVPLTTGRLRALLATLAMSVNRLVPMGQLAEAVWDTDPPADVRRSLSTYVSRLRAALGSDAIATAPGGYALRADPDGVDASRFLRLVDAVPDRAGVAEQAALLDAALRLWRGMPFEGVPSRWLTTISAPRLVEAYLAATEGRIDLDLGRARHTELVAQLTELTCRFPLRESLWLRLLVVLDRAGCPAEALARYEQLRAYLADELGVDPRPELQRAHADLLAGRRPQLSGPAPDGSGRPVAHLPPGQLPADLETFTGRAATVAELDRLVPGDTTGTPAKLPIVVVHGPPGAGKTALAVHWAHRVKNRFPDGQLYVDLRGYDPGRSAMSAAEAVRCLLTSLPDRPEHLPSGLAAQAGLFRSLIAGRRMLLVLDNAHHVDQVRPLLPGAAGCLVLVTSRSEFPGLVTAEGAHPVRLDLLTAAEARELLVRRLGEARTAAEPEAVGSIVARCAGLPLALAILAARAAGNPGFPLSALSAELRDTPGRLDAFAAGDPATDLRAVFSWSYRTLSPGAARLFRLLGLLAGPDITAVVAAAVTGASPRQARLELSELTRANLIREHEPGRYALHDLIRAFATELAYQHDDAGERTAAIARWLGFYLSTLWRTRPLPSARADTRWCGGELDLPDGAALEWFGAERGNLLAAVRQAAAAPGVPQQVALQLAHGLFPFFPAHPQWDGWAAVHEIALTVARRLDDRAVEAQIAYELGVSSWPRVRVPELLPDGHARSR